VAILLDDLPFDDQTRPLLLSGVPFQDETGHPLQVLHDQIVFWASLTPVGHTPPVGEAGCFPIVIDSGFNDSFLISEAQLRVWAGLSPAALPRHSSSLRISSQLTLTRYAAELWVHPNKPGSRDPSGVPAVRVALPDGIAVWPQIIPGAKRLPLLGVRALRWQGLGLSIDGAHCRVSLRNSDP
jgi:hypothetical protein